METVQQPVAPTEAEPTIKEPRRSPWPGSIASALFLAAVWLLEDRIGERTNPTTILLYMPQHIFGVVPGWLLVKSLQLRNWNLAVLNGGAVLFFLFYLLGLNIPFGKGGSGNRQVRVMTYNTRFGGASPGKTAQAIHSQKPDIVCMQETTPNLGDDNPNDKTTDMLKHFPGWYVARSKEVTTISRFPIVSQREYQMPRPNSRLLLETEIDTPAGRMTVFNAHIATAPGGANHRWNNSLPGHLWSIATRTHATAQARARQLPILDRALADCTTPYVLMGDFNNPPRGRFYRHLSSRLTDAFRAAGSGLGHTFSNRLPTMRIDYIWLGPGVSAQSCFVPRLYASDHRAVVADIQLGSSD